MSIPETVALLASRFGWNEEEVTERTVWYNVQEYARLAVRDEAADMARMTMAARGDGEKVTALIQDVFDSTETEKDATQKAVQQVKNWAKMALRAGNTKEAQRLKEHAQYLELLPLLKIKPEAKNG